MTNKIMDYKKKYNEALKDMMAIYPNLKGDAKLAVEHAFPELAESEDERIRKWLIKTIHLIGVDKDICADQETMDKAIAWLEKQKPMYNLEIPAGDVAPAEEDGPSDNDYNYDDKIRSLILETVFSVYGESAEYNDCLTYLEKQKEQNPEDTKIAFGDWGDKEKQEAIITCLKYMRFIKKITNQEYDDLAKWLNDNLVSNVLEKDGWTIANEQIDAIKEDYYGAFLRGEMRGYLRGVKQKEQKPASAEDMPYITDEHFFEREPKDSFRYKLAKYMTQNSRKEESPDGYTYHISAETILEMAKEELLKRGVVQKPVEWGEEDEGMRNNILRLLQCFEGTAECESNPSLSTSYPLYMREIAWLKSLRPQPKRDGGDDYNKGYIKGRADTLKESWKPSEEQMTNLLRAEGRLRIEGDSILASKLAEFYEQLKKLM